MKVTCIQCGTEFEKSTAEVKRVTHEKRDHYCSRKCQYKHNPKGKKTFSSPQEEEEFRMKEAIKASKASFESRMNYYLKVCEKRRKDSNREVNLTLADLIEVWNNQQGICPYSGIQLRLKTFYVEDRDPIYIASLDRIDSSKGYVKGNVQFVSMSINYMKNTMTHEETIKMCKLIAQHHNN